MAMVDEVSYIQWLKSQPTWSKGRQSSGAVLHSPRELGELTQ